MADRKIGRPPTIRGAYNPNPARQLGRVSDEDWNEIKAACEAAGLSLVVRELPDQIVAMIEAQQAAIGKTAIAASAGTACSTPYILKEVTTTVRLKNPDFGDDRLCKCGHTYERHFDPFECDDDQDVGCKYCECSDFVEA